MSSTLEAPKSMSRRESVSQLLRDLPAAAANGELVIGFNVDSSPTTSFMDELVRQTLAEDRCQRLTMLDADEFVQELATVAAERYGVAERLTFG